MLSSRRVRATGLTAVLILCILFYVTNGARSTHESAFYKRTVAAIQNRELAQARESVIEQERQRAERISQVEREHHAALSAAAAEGTRTQSGDGTNQKPMMPDGEYGASRVADAEAGEKSVAGRKYIKDGKVVTYKPSEGNDYDGVAKFGNVDPRSSHAAKADDSDEAIEAALNDILRRGPIIIFSKSYCPHSKKAKHILLDQYSIVPPPYVVELDQHSLGPALQTALEKLTGRRTVPNVLINGRSIGGGDDVQDMDNNDTLASTIQTMGGKRMTKVQRIEEVRKAEMRFKA